MGAEKIGHCFGGETLFPDGGAQVVEDVRIIRIQSKGFAKNGLCFGVPPLAEQPSAVAEKGSGGRMGPIAGGRFTAWGMRTWTSPFMG